jgi:tRNA pseudouridine55 synthase
VEKGAGVTSFEVVAHLRRLLRAHKVGHGGTLDPGATGVLPILIGEATKLTPYLADLDKEYLATVTLGVVTDTQDASGRVLERREVPSGIAGRLGEVLRGFVGEIAQVPPMYSALHHAGRRLYEIAREGGEIERHPRRVTIHAIAVEAVAGSSFTMRVRCGKGTYIRALASDVGEALGCGASLATLVRTRVGPFELASALPWAALRECRGGASLWSRVLPVDAPLQALPRLVLPPEAMRAFLHGRAVGAEVSGPGLFRVYGPDGVLLGLGSGLRGAVKPERILHADPSRAGGGPR